MEVDGVGVGGRGGGGGGGGGTGDLLTYIYNMKSQEHESNPDKTNHLY